MDFVCEVFSDTHDHVVVAYYTLMPYFIERETLTKKQARGLPDRISCYLIARLVLDRGLHGQGLSSHLLASARGRAAIGARDLGGRYVIVDSIDDAVSGHRDRHLTMFSQQGLRCRAVA